MADIHVLAGDGKSRWSIVAHFAVPDASNSVSVNWRTALVNSGLGGSSLIEGTGAGQITAAELAQVNAGALFEHHFQFLAESGGSSNLELQAALRSEYAKHETAVLASLQRRLKYFGHTESKE